MTKRYQPREKSRLINEIYASGAISKLRRDEYEAERDAYKASKKGQFEQEIRTAIQAITREEDRSLNIYLKAMDQLKESIFDLIKKYLLDKNETVEDASLEDIEAALSYTSIAIGKLKKMCNSEQYKEHLIAGYLNEYEKLFKKLVDKLDVRFALYAPKRSLSRKTIRFHKMPEELKDRLFDYLEKMGLLNDMEYLEAYAEVFENQIASKGIEL